MTNPEKTNPITGAKETGGDRQPAERAKRAAADVGTEMREHAASAATAVRQNAMDRAETAREGVAEDIAAIARALQRGGEELPPESPQARVWSGVAERASTTAEALRTQDLPTVMRRVGDFARENPTTFLVGAALLGFAASRFALASDTGGAAMQGEYRA